MKNDFKTMSIATGEAIRARYLNHLTEEKFLRGVVSIAELYSKSLGPKPWQQTLFRIILVNPEAARQHVAKIIPDVQCWELYALGAVYRISSFLRNPAANESSTGFLELQGELVDLLGAAGMFRAASESLPSDFFESLVKNVERGIRSEAAKRSHSGTWAHKKKVQEHLRRGFEEGSKAFGSYENATEAAEECEKLFHVGAIRKKGVNPLPTLKRWIWEEYHRIEREAPHLLKSTSPRAKKA